ncbi:MAG: hypothetical protein RL590_791 [Actinomycetota bacterium]
MSFKRGWYERINQNSTLLEEIMAVAKKAAAKKAVAKKSVEIETRHIGVDWRSLYLYAVCLITLLVVLFSTVSLINAIMNAVFPDPAYIDIYAKPDNAPSAELLAQQEENNQIQAIKNIFTSFTTIAIAAPLYLYHWRQTKKSA